MQKTFRLFLSSTFGDFQVEREALKERVWPQLEAYCASRNASFQVVDLRWGISESDGLAHDTLRICLDEIAHCQQLSPKPNFLMLLGDRYGWRPLPPEIPADEFELVIKEATITDAKRLRDWYLWDNNALPPHYVLRARGEAYRVYADWQGIESELLRTLRACAMKLGRTPFRDELYFYSATHQEIVRGTLTVSDADQHVFAFIREIDGLDFKSHRAKNFTDWDRNGHFDTEARDLRLELREQFVQKLPAKENKLHCKVRWQGQEKSPISTEHINQLCEYVDDSLRRVIDQELDATSTDNLEKETAAHQDTAHRLAKIFIGRNKQLIQLTDAVRIGLDHIESTAHISGFVWINGPGGVGKSAFMARALEDTRNQYPDAIVIKRFIGTTHRSCNLFTFLADLLTELAQSRNSDETLPEGGLQDLIEILPERMSWATAEKPLILFIDALDQLNDSFFTRQHLWLPAVLPPHVVVVLSVLDGLMSVNLQNRFPKVTRIDLTPFNAKEGEVMLDALLLKGGDRTRRLCDAQKKLVLDAFQHDGRPLYLSLAAVECRRWRSWYEPSPFPNRLEDLIQRFVTKLQVIHGSVMVDRALAYLSAGRFGISDQEMRDILWKDPCARAEFKSLKNQDQPPVTSLPSVIWARIYFDLAPYLVEQGATGAWLYRFYHRIIAEEVTRYHLVGHAAEVHGRIAKYFYKQNLHLQDGIRLVPNFRKLAEEPWQRIKAGQLDEAEKVLTDFPFAMAKCEAGLFDELLDDYRLLTEAVQQGGKSISETLRAWDSLMRNGAHILRRGNFEWPAHKILLQLAMEHADNSPVTLAAERWLREGRCDWAWMKRNDRPQFYVPDPCLMVLEGHTSCVSGAEVLADGRILSHSWDKTLRLWDGKSGTLLATLKGHSGIVRGAKILPDGRILSWSWDSTLRLWDGKSGEAIAVFMGHTAVVQGALLLPGDRILSWADDFTLRIWNCNNAACLGVLEGHWDSVEGAQLLPNQKIVSWSNDSTLRLWDSTNGDAIAELAEHTEGVNGVLSLPNDRMLSWSEDSMQLWDVENGRSLGQLIGHNSSVVASQYLPDGRILSWSKDCTLLLWDGKSGAVLAVLDGHTKIVTGAHLLPDGRILSWSGDFTLRLWDGTSGAPIAVLQGHTMTVSGAQSLPDGRILSWSGDFTLRLWDGTSGAAIGVMRGHGGWIDSAQSLPDGRILSWSTDCTLRLWDGHSRNELNRLQEQPAFVEHFQALPDGRILSWARGYPMRLWDGNKGVALVAVLEEKSGIVSNAELLQDGRILSESGDFTLRLWDGSSGDAIAVLRYELGGGGMNWEDGAQLLADGRILVWSGNTLLLWSGKIGEELQALEGHTDRVTGAHVLPDGRVLSWSSDGTLRLWDSTNKVAHKVLKSGSPFPVNGAQLLADGRILSWSSVGAMRLWDGQSGAAIAELRDHIGWRFSAQLLADGRILWWSNDFTLRLWDGNTSVSQMTLEGHERWANGAQQLPDGRILTWSDDHMLGVWDGNSGALIYWLKGHTGSVRGAQLLPDGRVRSWSDDGTVRIWDCDSGNCLDMLDANWVEIDDFPGIWLNQSERASVCNRGSWRAQAIDRRVSIGNVETSQRARWQAELAAKLVQTASGPICAHIKSELVFLETWQGNRRLI